MPQKWAEDRKRRRKAGVPEGISFKTRPEIALEHLRGTYEAGVVCGVVLTDAGASAEAHLCTNIAARESSYVALRATEHHDLALGYGAVAAPKIVELWRPPRLMRHHGSQKPSAHLHAAMLSRKTVAAQEFMRQ